MCPEEKKMRFSNASATGVSFRKDLELHTDLCQLYNYSLHLIIVDREIAFSSVYLLSKSKYHSKGQRMKNKKRDITQKLICEEGLRHQLTSIFIDSIILRNDFQIALISKSILDMLGFEMSELHGQSIHFLSENISLEEELENELAQGFFDQMTISLKTKNNGPIWFTISGFYLGLISDLNGYVVLTIKEVDVVTGLRNKVEESQNELDEFIYRAAHDLRGPLATIRGLANVMKLEKISGEMTHLIEMLDKQAEKLDDRLFKLHYLADSCQSETTNDTMDFHILESSLRSTLEECMGVNYAYFHFSPSNECIKGVHGQLVISMLNNILLYLISLPKNQTTELVFSVLAHQIGIQFNINARGFQSNHEIRQGVSKTGSVYSNMLTYTHLVNYYAAQKIARKINASIQVNFMRDEDQLVSVFVPFAYGALPSSYTSISTS
jgi:signal transduction histidine kinase